MNKAIILKAGTYFSPMGKEIIITDEVLQDIMVNTSSVDVPIEGLGDKSAGLSLIFFQKGRLEIEFSGDLGDKELRASLLFGDRGASIHHLEAVENTTPKLLANIQEALGWKPSSFWVQGDEGLYQPFRKSSSPSDHELILRLAEAEKECRQLREELARACVDAEILEWGTWKEFPQPMQERVRIFALKEIENGKEPKEAVASFAEHLPDKKRARFGAPMIAQTAELLGKEFAIKKAEYEAQGLSPSAAYDKAQKDLQGECL